MRPVWDDLDQKGVQYSATDQHSAIADDLSVCADAPQEVPVSFCRRLFLVLIFAAVLVKCCL